MIMIDSCGTVHCVPSDVDDTGDMDDSGEMLTAAELQEAGLLSGNPVPITVATSLPNDSDVIQYLLPASASEVGCPGLPYTHDKHFFF